MKRMTDERLAEIVEIWYGPRYHPKHKGYEELGEEVLQALKAERAKASILEGANSIKSEFLSSRQCPDHSGKWERGRCLQCEIEKLQAKVAELEGENRRLTSCTGKKGFQIIIEDAPELAIDVFSSALVRLGDVNQKLEAVREVDEEPPSMALGIYSDEYLDGWWDCREHFLMALRDKESGGD